MLTNDYRSWGLFFNHQHVDITMSTQTQKVQTIAASLCLFLMEVLLCNIIIAKDSWEQ